MRVRALESFLDESGLHSTGDEWEMTDSVAAVRVRAGLVQRVVEEPQTATMPEPEMAVSRRGRR